MFMGLSSCPSLQSTGTQIPQIHADFLNFYPICEIRVHLCPILGQLRKFQLANFNTSCCHYFAHWQVSRIIAGLGGIAVASGGFAVDKHAAAALQNNPLVAGLALKSPVGRSVRRRVDGKAAHRSRWLPHNIDIQTQLP